MEYSLLVFLFLRTDQSYVNLFVIFLLDLKLSFIFAVIIRWSDPVLLKELYYIVLRKITKSYYIYLYLLFSLFSNIPYYITYFKMINYNYLKNLYSFYSFIITFILILIPIFLICLFIFIYFIFIYFLYLIND